MKSLQGIRSGRRATRWAALLVMVALPGVMAYARPHHSESWARDRFAAAERMREALNGRPPADRTRHDYQRVLNAYRSVYYGAPTSTKADPSVVAVAEMLVEMGRRFDDDKILKSAIGQYKFLRREYPGSKYRCDALFTIGEIYQDDLNDPEQARSAFEEFLRRYPHNRLADDAQQAITQLNRAAEDEKKAATKKKRGKEVVADGGAKDSAPATAKDAVGKDSSAKEAETRSDADASGVHHSGKVPRVTGIRHWSTPDYTRVAIDLENEIKFGSQRIADPDRIFFDLRDTKLASTLVGKTFDVDDGFLKKIRVAQFQPGRTRVVLEVDNLSDYDAFLLPNPYRLIIDIHGKDARKKESKSAQAKLTKEETAALADVEAPPKTSAKPDVPKSEVKADLKALAGKPATQTEEIHDNGARSKEETIDPDRMGAARAVVSAENAAFNGKSNTNSATKDAPVKKVIVDNDDDDDSTPVEAAERAVKPRSRTKSVAHKTVAPADADDSSSDDVASNDAPASSVRSRSRLSSSRRANDLDVREARPTAGGDRSLIRALGLKIGKIVIDPGHGGHDTGTIGPDGLEEKDLVLEVGRRLGKMLESRLGAEVVYTRKDDTFIPLETRTAIANQQRADLFISIHANSSHDETARGVETYYLNFTSSPEALEVAARENAVSEKSVYELQDLVKKIALKEKIEESREFAGDVQESLHSGLAAKSPAIRNRGVKKAPFIVLIGANMPSILAEISFVSNPTDEHRLETSEYRQRIAESLYRGIAKYANGLSGVKLASKMGAGQ